MYLHVPRRIPPSTWPCHWAVSTLSTHILKSHLAPRKVLARTGKVGGGARGGGVPRGGRGFSDRGGPWDGGGPEVGEVFKTQTSQETKLKINPTGDHAAYSWKISFFCHENWFLFKSSIGTHNRCQRANSCSFRANLKRISHLLRPLQNTIYYDIWYGCPFVVKDQGLS